MMSRHRQRGMTFIGWMVLLGMIGFLVMIGLKLMPPYMEFFKVRSTLDSVASEINNETTTAEIRQMVGARFQVNDVRTINNRDIVINRDGGILTLTVNYEYRTPMFANVDAVVMFEKSVEAGAR